MRLKNYQIESIKKYSKSIFGEAVKVFLFGSRVDDNKRGGDIDLYIIPQKRDNLMEKKIKFLVKLKRDIGEQKVDVVFDRGEDKLIDRVAKKGIKLWEN